MPSGSRPSPSRTVRADREQNSQRLANDETDDDAPRDPARHRRMNGHGSRRVRRRSRARTPGPPAGSTTGAAVVAAPRAPDGRAPVTRRSQQSEHDPGDRRVDPGLVGADPERDRGHHVEQWVRRARGGARRTISTMTATAAATSSRTRRGRNRTARSRRSRRCRRRSRASAGRASAARNARTEGGEQDQRERDVGRHRNCPAARARSARRSPRGRAAPGTTMPPSAAITGRLACARIAQLAVHELALDLQPDDEEEHRHQAVVHPVPKVERQSERRPTDREVVGPERRCTTRRRRSPTRTRRTVATSSTVPPSASTETNSLPTGASARPTTGTRI